MNRNDIEIGRGLQLSLMDNVPQLTLGSDLQAESY